IKLCRSIVPSRLTSPTLSSYGPPPVEATMITVRTGRPDDLPVIVDYNQRLAQESEGKALDRAVLERGVRRVLGDPTPATYYVAEREGRVMGKLMIPLEWSDWRDGWIWWIQSVYVHPDARRVGAFKSLYHHVIEQAHKQGDVAGI